MSWIPDALETRPVQDEAVAAVRDYHVNVIAWGTDPGYVPAETLISLNQRFKEAGVERIAWCCCLNIMPGKDFEHGGRPRECSDWSRHMVVDFLGQPITLPFWKNELWACANHPGYREFLLRRIKTSLDAGADAINVDNHIQGSWNVLFAVQWGQNPDALVGALGGCFCDACVDGFRRYLVRRFSEHERCDMGIRDVDTFDYRKILRAVASNRSQFIAAYASGELPFIDLYIQYQAENQLAISTCLKEFIVRHAQRQVAYSTNATSLFPNELADAHLVDHFVAETYYLRQPGKIAIVPYKLAEALGKGIATWPVAPDAACIIRESRTDLLRFWIAASYAMGGNMMVPHALYAENVHGGSLSAMDYAPIYHFIRNHKQFFDDYTAMAQVAVLYSNQAQAQQIWNCVQACAEGRAVDSLGMMFTSLHQLSLELTRLNIPFRFAVAGDQWLQHTLQPHELADCQRIFVPEPVCLDSRQKAVLSRFSDKVYPWHSSADTNAILDGLTPWLQLDASKLPVWLLPRRHIKDSTAPIVIHILNAGYDWDENRIPPVTNLTIHMDTAMAGGKMPRNITCLSPGHPPLNLPFYAQSNTVTISIPQLELWNLIVIE